MTTLKRPLRCVPLRSTKNRVLRKVRVYLFALSGLVYHPLKANLGAASTLKSICEQRIVFEMGAVLISSDTRCSSIFFCQKRGEYSYGTRTLTFVCYWYDSLLRMLSFAKLRHFRLCKSHPVFCTLYNVSSVHRGMFSTSGGYHEYIGGCSVHRRDNMSTSGGVQYIGGIT